MNAPALQPVRSRAKCEHPYPLAGGDAYPTGVKEGQWSRAEHCIVCQSTFSKRIHRSDVKEIEIWRALAKWQSQGTRHVGIQPGRAYGTQLVTLTGGGVAATAEHRELAEAVAIALEKASR